MSLRSIFKLDSAGVWLKLWPVRRGMPRAKAEFSPRTLCPFSLMSWNTVLISDYLRHHKTTHIPIPEHLNSGLWSCNEFANVFRDYLFSWSAGVGSVFYQLIQATGTPNGRNVSPILLYHSGQFSSTARVHPYGFILSIMAACNSLLHR